MSFGAREEAELRATLRAFGAAHAPVVLPGGAGKALEAWLMMRLARSADRKPGWSASLRGGDGRPLAAGAVFRLRLQPGRIKRADPNAAGFVAIEPDSAAPAMALELHGGLKWQGRSGATHECDLSILPARIGAAIRRVRDGGYPRGLPLMAIECKDKTSDAPPDEMRQTLARLFDLACLSQAREGSPYRIFGGGTGWGWRTNSYRGFFFRSLFGIARATGFQPGARKLGHHYFISRFPNIYDRSTGWSLRALMDRFCALLDDVVALKG